MKEECIFVKVDLWNYGVKPNKKTLRGTHYTQSFKELALMELQNLALAIGILNNDLKTLIE